MNPEQLTNKVAEAIAQRPASAAKKFCIYHDAQGFHCEPVIEAPPDSFKIGVFSASNLNDGFTNKDWSLVLRQCSKLLAKGSV